MVRLEVRAFFLRSWLFLQIERTLFEDTVKTLNNYYAEAEKISGQSYLEGCLACVSAYVIFLCMETQYEKVLICSSFNPFTPQSAVTVFLLKSFHIASFDKRETTAIQSLQCFWKDWIWFWRATSLKCDHTCIQRSRWKLFMNARLKMFWCLMCSDPPCFQMLHLPTSSHCDSMLKCLHLFASDCTWISEFCAMAGSKWHLINLSSSALPDPYSDEIEMK